MNKSNDFSGSMILAMIQIIIGALFLFTGLIVLSFGPEYLNKISEIGFSANFIYGLIFSFGLLFLVSGIGLRRKRRWGWLLSICVYGYLILGNLFLILNGETVDISWAVVGGIILVYLFKKDIRSSFKTNSLSRDC